MFLFLIYSNYIFFGSFIGFLLHEKLMCQQINFPSINSFTIFVVYYKFQMSEVDKTSINFHVCLVFTPFISFTHPLNEQITKRRGGVKKNELISIPSWRYKAIVRHDKNNQKYFSFFFVQPLILTFSKSARKLMELMEYKVRCTNRTNSELQGS